MKDFVPYNESLDLRDLEFNEPCFGFSRNDRQDKKLEFTNIELAKNYNGINSKDLFLNKKKTCIYLCLVQHSLRLSDFLERSLKVKYGLT